MGAGCTQIFLGALDFKKSLFSNLTRKKIILPDYYDKQISIKQNFINETSKNGYQDQ